MCLRGNFCGLLTLHYTYNNQLFRRSTMESTQQHDSCFTLVPWSKSPSLYVESRADLEYVGNRAATFLFYPPSKVSTSSLIDAGFYYTGDEDICRCYKCKMELKQLQIGDIPCEIHQLMSPQCPLSSCTQPEKVDSSAAQCVAATYISTARVRKPKPVPAIGNILYFWVIYTN